MSLKGTNRSHRKGKEPRSVLIASALSAMLWMGALTSSLCLALWLNPFTPVAAFAAETSVENSAKNSPETPAEKTAIASEETNSSKAAEMVDLDRRGSISLTFTYYDETSQKTYPVTGGYSVGLYKVADVIVDNGFKFKTDERFSAAGEIPATDEALDSANQKLAADMAGIAAAYDYDIKPQAMDAEGKVYFDGLEVGLYLVKQAEKGSGDKAYTIAPFPDLDSRPRNGRIAQLRRRRQDQAGPDRQKGPARARKARQTQPQAPPDGPTLVAFHGHGGCRRPVYHYWTCREGKKVIL